MLMNKVEKIINFNNEYSDRNPNRYEEIFMIGPIVNLLNILIVVYVNSIDLKNMEI